MAVMPYAIDRRGVANVLGHLESAWLISTKARARVGRIWRKTLRLGLVIIAARIERDGAVFVAAGGAIGAGEIAHRVSHIDLRIEQLGGRTGKAHGARRAEPDLHQTVIAAAHRTRIAAALALDDALDQRHRHAVGARLRRRHAVERRGLIEAVLTPVALAPIVLAPIADARMALRLSSLLGRAIGSVG